MPKVSILMRSKNEYPYVKYTLRMLKSQTMQDYELVCVDSGSTDGTWELVQTAGASVCYQIPPESYVPGRVLNEAITHCTGDYIVFNNADCIPLHSEWLEQLIRPLDEDPSVICTFANQLPRPNAFPLVVKDYRRAFGDGSISSGWRHFFSLASCAVRAETIRSHPFNPQLQYSEDIDWSWRMKQLGLKILYVPEAQVEHSHNYTLPQLRKRFLGEGRADQAIYANEPASLWGCVIRPWVVEVARDALFLVREKVPYLIPFALIYRGVQKLAYWQGRNS